MQVYKGLDVLTNKVSVVEQKGVPHHLLGSISSMVEFTINDFKDNAIRMPVVSSEIGQSKANSRDILHIFFLLEEFFHMLILQVLVRVVFFCDSQMVPLPPASSQP
nr:tRNA dimethylallyltransferase 2 isoform X2 [Tanacetum cinerariifolium]